MNLFKISKPRSSVVSPETSALVDKWLKEHAHELITDGKCGCIQRRSSCLDRQKRKLHNYGESEDDDDISGRLRAEFQVCGGTEHTKPCKYFRRKNNPEVPQSLIAVGLSPEGKQASFDRRRIARIKVGRLFEKLTNPQKYTEISLRQAQFHKAASEKAAGATNSERVVSEIQTRMREKLVSNKEKAGPLSLSVYLLPMAMRTGYSRQALREFMNGVYKGNSERVAQALRTYFEAHSNKRLIHTGANSEEAPG